jgi:restriction endonuclease S subunit
MAKINQIAEVQFGLYKKKSKKGDIKYLTTGHFDNFLNPTLFDDSFINITGKDTKFLLQPNDLILTGKGQRIFAWSYDESFGKVVPSSLFYIIRANAALIDSRYLAAVLNSGQKRYELELLGVGSSITSIAKNDVLDFEIPLPSLEEQQKVIKVLALLEEEISLTNKILEKKKALKKGVLNELITNKMKL